MRRKWTLVTVNGRTMLVFLPVSADGRVRVKLGRLLALFGVRPGDCVRL